ARQLGAELLRLHARRQAPGNDFDDLAHAGPHVRDRALSRRRERLPHGAGDATGTQAARRAEGADQALSRPARAAALAALALAAAGPVAAWNNHALGTWPALAPMAELSTLRPV